MVPGEPLQARTVVLAASGLRAERFRQLYRPGCRTINCFYADYMINGPAADDESYPH